MFGGMKRIARSLFAAVVFFVLVVLTRQARAYVPPTLQGAVTDTAGKLSVGERSAIEARLETYRTRTTNEVVVFVIGSLAGENVEDVAYGAFNTWGIGKKGKDNGVLL